MTGLPLPVIPPDGVTALRPPPVPSEVARQASDIVEAVRREGETALRRYSEGFGDISPGAELVIGANDLRAALVDLDAGTRELLERVAGRVRRFAVAQMGAIRPVRVEVDGGRAGHRLIPVATAGAYAPGGRHPLPSSVLMTVIPARVAGVNEVWVASPRPSSVTLAAAAIAGADGLLATGGAQSIAALAFGTVTPRCDMVVGPGNAWVTAAKKHLYGEIGIDGLAGPSEILVIADDTANPGLIAADLIAQAEHDPMARPMLVAAAPGIVDAVEEALVAQLEDLPTSRVAGAALAGGFATEVASLEAAVALSEHIGPEHLALHVGEPESLADRLQSYGSLFLGHASAEALADYGVGPNHVLPTAGGARHQSGLSVFSFLRTPTWLEIEDPLPTAGDAALLARLEGLEAHARAAERRVS